MRRVHVVVRGVVQGVGYRYTLRLVATHVGADGWVRNRRDGSVEAEIQAGADQVDEILTWMAQGPPGSRVDAAEVADVATERDRGFEVRPTA